MNKLLILIVLAFVLFIIIFSCERTSSPPMPPGELKTIILDDLKGIPLEYGSLIAVTTTHLEQSRAQLWFEDSDKTIRLVRLEYTEDRINPVVTIIPRY